MHVFVYVCIYMCVFVHKLCLCWFATAERGVVYTLSSTMCTCEYASHVSCWRDHKVNMPPQSSLYSFLQKEQTFSEAVQSTDENHNITEILQTPPWLATILSSWRA